MIPEAFLERMQALLGEEYEAFYHALSREENVHAVRYNPDKIKKEDFLTAMAEHLSPLSYTADGFLCDLLKVGHHPLHHAGAIYSQDPGAMAPLNCLDIQKGWRVADFCASPGGKSTQLASAIGDDGFLLSNEVSLPRCKVLAGNMERLGVKNAVVTNLSTDILAAWFRSYFDLVVVDAPCSGEGMFRKYDVAGEEWKPELIPICAKRQAAILENAAGTIKDGGYLLYSTCTFSIEENEANVDAFLEAHPEFTVCEVNEAVKRVTANGVAFRDANHPEALVRARRFYPHIQAGEGQFMCLLQKRSDHSEREAITYRPSIAALSKEEERVVDAFLKDVLQKPWKELLPNYIFQKQGEMISLVPNQLPPLPHHVYLAGVTLGNVQKGRFTPHHHLFSALGKYFKNRLPLLLDTKELAAYLHGDTLKAELPNGYAVVTVLGAAVGGIKVVDGVGKNHYPKGLRTP